MIVNWRALDNVFCPRLCLIFTLVALFGLGLMYNDPKKIGYGFYDNTMMANLGGWLCGIMVGLWTVPPVRRVAVTPGSYEKFCHFTGVCLICGFYLMMFLLFFLKSEKTDYFASSKVVTETIENIPE